MPDRRRSAARRAAPPLARADRATPRSAPPPDRRANAGGRSRATRPPSWSISTGASARPTLSRRSLDEPAHLIGRAAIAPEQDEARRIGVGEEAPLVERAAPRRRSQGRRREVRSARRIVSTRRCPVRNDVTTQSARIKPGQVGYRSAAPAEDGLPPLVPAMTALRTEERAALADRARQRTMMHPRWRCRSSPQIRSAVERVGDRPGLDPVVDALVAEIGADRDRRQRTEQIGILALQSLPFAARFALAAHGAELHPQPAAFSGAAARRLGSGRDAVARAAAASSAPAARRSGRGRSARECALETAEAGAVAVGAGAGGAEGAAAAGAAVWARRRSRRAAAPGAPSAARAAAADVRPAGAARRRSACRGREPACPPGSSGLTLIGRVSARISGIVRTAARRRMPGPAMIGQPQAAGEDAHDDQRADDPQADARARRDPRRAVGEELGSAPRGRPVRDCRPSLTSPRPARPRSRRGRKR